MRTLTEAQHKRLESKHLGDDVRVVGWNDVHEGPILYSPGVDRYAVLATNGSMRQAPYHA